MSRTFRAVALTTALAAVVAPSPVAARGAVAAPAEPSASEGQTVEGTVTDSTGAVLIGAEVTLRDASGSFKRTTATDARGHYRFAGVPAAAYLLDAFRDGFSPVTREVQAAAGVAAVDISLTPASFSEEITVSFTGDHAVTALKMDAPVRDIPLTVKSYTNSFIEAVDAKQVADLYTYMNGVNRAGDNAYDMTMRGFEATDPGTLQQNGMIGLAARMNSPNVANVERIEVLKGPASVLYGQAKPGGLVNIITERPQNERQHLLDLRTGTFFGTGPGFGDANSYRGSVNLTGPVGDSTRFLYRFVAAVESAESFRDFVDNSEVFVVPSLSWNVSPGTMLTLEAEYRKIDNAFDNALMAPLNDIRFVGPITVRYQEPDDFQNEKGWTVSAFFNKLFAGDTNWNLNWRSVLHDDERFAFENNRVEADNQRVRRRDRHQVNSRTYHFVDTTLRKPVTLGSVQNNLLLGLNGGFEQSDFDRLRFGNVGFFVDIDNPVYGAERPANPNPGTHAVSDFNRFGVYVQDQINFSPRWKGLAALRYDREDMHVEELRVANTPDIDEVVDAVVPTGGIVFQPDHRWSLYGSYSQSFTPPPAAAVDAAGQRNFDPEQGEQLEGGVKATLLNGRVDATAAYFTITKKNVIVDIGNGASDQIGEEQSKGVEFDLRVNPTKSWQAIFGYTFIDATITEDTNPRRVGAMTRNTPRHAFNVWSRYDISSGRARGLGLGLGLIYRGDRAGSFPDQEVRGNPIPGEPFPSAVLQLPSYFRADAGVYFVKSRYELTLRVNNLFDEIYYEGAFNLIRIRPGNPREATLSLRLRL